MSGGVDSSVSAALLKKAGFDVTGMFIKCWDAADPLGENCTSSDDERMARLAAAQIGIPFYSINFVKEYKQKVVEYLLDGYKKGITPNPDVMCNKEIKFGLFFDKAMELGADFVATGHYARVQKSANNSRSRIISTKLLMGKDKNKDQSYFLSFIKPEVLEHVLFPIGEYTKQEVRALAKKFDLPNADRKSSQGICFIGKVDFAEFLKQYISPERGKIADMQGNTLGEHEGAWYYTIGQRSGLGLAGGPYFVVDKDVKKNIVVVSKNERDLEKNEVLLQDMNWFVDCLRFDFKQQITTKLRYRQTSTSARIKKGNKKEVVLRFDIPQRAVTPGQLGVLYSGDQMLGAGVIQ